MAEAREGLAGLARLRPAHPGRAAGRARQAQARRAGPRLRHRPPQGRRGPGLGQGRHRQVLVNGKVMGTYFARPTLQMIIGQPFDVINRLGQYDVMCTVAGGGLSGQAGAVRHGLSRALITYDPALRPLLKQGGFLTRDDREVERKKYGKAKARRSFQFSKR